MKMAKLYEPTGALVAGMDKKKAARQAASVASAVANGNGAPHIRVVARIVAHTLTAIGNQQADGAAAVRSPSRRATALTTPARCWCGIRRSRAPPRQSSAGPQGRGAGGRGASGRPGGHRRRRVPHRRPGAGVGPSNPRY